VQAASQLTEVLISTAFVRECIMTPEKERACFMRPLAAGHLPSTVCRRSTSPSTICTRKGLVSYETALENASNPDDFKLKVQGHPFHKRMRHASKWSKLDFSAGRA